MYHPDPPLVALFALDRDDPHVAVRAAAFSHHGMETLGFTFHTEPAFPSAPAWRNIDLGELRGQRRPGRLHRLAVGMGTLWRERDRLSQRSLIYVIGGGNVPLALVARFFTGTCMPMVVDLGHRQPARSRMMRALERWLLRRCALVVADSPGVVEGYFPPAHPYHGRTFLLDESILPSGPARAPRERSHDALVVEMARL